MTDRELYQQKMQAKLDEWRADIAKLKAKAKAASADAQLEMRGHITTLEGKIEAGKAKLAEFAEASNDAWTVLKHDVETTWDSLKTDFNAFAAKFKD